MRFALASLVVSLLAAFAVAVAPTLHDVIISFPKDTPDSVVRQAKQKVLDAGGVITHEYNIIKGFAAKAAKDTFAGIQALDAKYPAVIEGDGIMHTQDD